jgi:hypothetical protein
MMQRSWLRYSLPFNKPECSLLFSQKTDTGLHLEPDRSNPHYTLHTLRVSPLFATLSRRYLQLEMFPETWRKSFRLWDGGWFGHEWPRSWVTFGIEVTLAAMASRKWREQRIHSGKINATSLHHGAQILRPSLWDILIIKSLKVQNCSKNFKELTWRRGKLYWAL